MPCLKGQSVIIILLIKMHRVPVAPGILDVSEPALSVTLQLNHFGDVANDVPYQAKVLDQLPKSELG
jgi:hypothetical protein